MFWFWNIEELELEAINKIKYPFDIADYLQIINSWHLYNIHDFCKKHVIWFVAIPFFWDNLGKNLILL